MTLPFARGLAPETPFLMAALLRDRRARRPRGRSWLRIAHRLAAGLPPAAAALPEGANEKLVLRLLRREEFSGFVEAAREELALPAEEQRRQLVVSARQTLERLLAWDDAPTAIFVLDQDCRNLDPAETLVDGILKARARTRPRDSGRKPNPRPGRPRDPLATLMHQGATRLRREIETESILRHAAIAAAPPPARTTAEAARHALALKKRETPAAPARAVPSFTSGLASHRRSGTAAVGSVLSELPERPKRAKAQGP
jgi:hypothetical protein